MRSLLARRVKQQPKLSSAACERCHKYKERCSFGESQAACSRCLALDTPCRPRVKKRMGRRPVARQPPYGAMSVMHLAGEVQCDGPGLTAGFAISTNEYQHGDQADRVVGQSKSPVLSNDTTSRDPCHQTLDFHPLRPPLHSCWQVHQLLDNTQIFLEVHRTFMVGRSFVKQFHFTVRRLFARAPQVLTDAYSVAMKLLKSRHEPTRVLEDHDLAIEAHCLQRLMDGAPSIAHPEDAAVILLLGQALLVYNALISSPATQVITRGTLLSVRRWYPDLVERSYLDGVTLIPVFMDTVECLIRREVPVIRLPVTKRCIVDRFLGLRSSLLPLLHDLCGLSYEARIVRLTPVPFTAASVDGDHYSDIERLIQGWTPQLPTDFFSAYSLSEVNVMLVQARSYRLAALLVIHRLRFPLGVEDPVAQNYATEIFDQLSILKQWPTDAPTGFGLDFPLLVATLELPAIGVDIYQVFESLRFRRQHSQRILDFVYHVVDARRHGFCGLWFDLVDSHMQGLILT